MWEGGGATRKTLKKKKFSKKTKQVAKEKCSTRTSEHPHSLENPTIIRNSSSNKGGREVTVAIAYWGAEKRGRGSTRPPRTGSKVI